MAPLGIDLFTFNRSITDKKGKVKWLGETKVREIAGFKMKLYVFLRVIDDRKWVVICSLVMMQIISSSFFIFSELSLPFSGSWALVSRISCYIILALILAFPLLFLTY